MPELGSPHPTFAPQVEKLDLEGVEENIKNAGLAEDEELPLKLAAGGILDVPAIQIKDVGFGYGDPAEDGWSPLFTNAEIGIGVSTRLVRQFQQDFAGGGRAGK